jgi:hypothetical protein
MRGSLTVTRKPLNIYVTLYEQMLFKIFHRDKIVTLLYFYFRLLNARYPNEQPVFAAVPATEK